MKKETLLLVISIVSVAVAAFSMTLLLLEKRPSESANTIPSLPRELPSPGSAFLDDDFDFGPLGPDSDLFAAKEDTLVAVRVDINPLEGITPKEFRVKPADKIVLTLTGGDECQVDLPENTGYWIPELTPTSDPKIFTASFGAPDRAGAYTISCNVPGHAERGIKGTMIVEL